MALLGDRFRGDRGPLLLSSELEKQRLFAGISSIAPTLARTGQVLDVGAGSEIIVQDDTTTDVFFIIEGTFGVFVNAKRVSTRYSGDTVGEMSAISPVQRRSATVVADTEAVVVCLTEEQFAALAHDHPAIWKRIAQELGRRLTQRNALIRPANESARVFVISSAEALPIARGIESAFSYDPFVTVVWANGVFRVTNYTLESLERELEQCDFAVAIAHPDDLTQSRDEDWPAPRDNVIFELGYFMGRLGRERAILMEPRGQRIKLPSDLAGITTIKYRIEPGIAAKDFLGPACNELRDHIIRLGRNI